MQFILFLDEVGAEFTSARTSRKEIVAAGYRQVMRFTPITVSPIEVIDEKGGARRAAGGFILLGPLGAALGVLSGKGAQVLFEMTEQDGTRRKGIVAQRDFGKLRLKIERMQRYQSGDLGRAIAAWCVFSVLFAVCVAAAGPAGIILALIAWFGVGRALRRARSRTA